jgi:hypothetical protein
MDDMRTAVHEVEAEDAVEVEGLGGRSRRRRKAEEAGTAVST